MRFGISATSRMEPKNLRTLLRPVNGWFMMTPVNLFKLLSATPATGSALRTAVSLAHALRSSRATPTYAGAALVSSRLGLLDLDLRSGPFQLGLELGSLVLRDAFLDRLRGGFDQILGFLQPERRDRADFLDDVD